MLSEVFDYRVICLNLSIGIFIVSVWLYLGRLLGSANDFRPPLLSDATDSHDCRCADRRILQWLKRNIVHLIRMIRYQVALHLCVPFGVCQPGISDPIQNNLILLSLLHLRELNTPLCYCIPNFSIAQDMQASALANASSLKVVAILGGREALEMLHEELIFFKLIELKCFLCPLLQIYFSISCTKKSFWWIVACLLCFDFFVFIGGGVG